MSDNNENNVVMNNQWKMIIIWNNENEIVIWKNNEMK